MEVSEKDVKDASAGVLRDLRRFQKEKEEDLQRYMVRGHLSCPILFDITQLLRSHRLTFKIYCWSSQIAYARCHLDWARKNLETWTEAKDEVDKIVAR